MRLRFGGLIFGRAYFWEGLFLDSLLRRHSFGSSRTPRGVRDEPKECLRRRLIFGGLIIEFYGIYRAYVDIIWISQFHFYVPFGSFLWHVRF